MPVPKGYALQAVSYTHLVAEDGAEIAYNVPDLVNKISAVNAESAGRRKDIDALTSQLKAFDGIDPEKAKAALETVANLDAGKLIDAGKVDDLKMAVSYTHLDVYKRQPPDANVLFTDESLDGCGGKRDSAVFL